MKITILGTRGEVKESAPGHIRHSGILVDQAILLDIGEREFLSLGPKAIFITHLHPDHAFFILEHAKIEADIPIYAPESHKNAEIIVTTGTVNVDAYRVTPFPTLHSKKFLSQGYVVEKDGQKLVYTGDLIRFDKLHHHLLENADLIVTDGSHLRRGGRVFRDKATGKVYGHAGIPDLINLMRPFTSNILFLHFGTWFYEDVSRSTDQIKELGRAHDMRVIVGRDGLELDLDDLVRRSAGQATLDQWQDSQDSESQKHQ